jgi:hypothetical protein
LSESEWEWSVVALMALLRRECGLARIPWAVKTFARVASDKDDWRGWKEAKAQRDKDREERGVERGRI